MRAMAQDQEEMHSARIELLAHIEKFMELPVSLLGFVWLALLIIEMVRGTTPFLNAVSIIIWGLFLVDFVLRFIIAPDKREYMKKNWLVALSLAVPALRFVQALRVMRVFSVIQGGSIITMMGSINRSMQSLNTTLKRRGFVYVAIITIAVILVGAAGMYAFEKRQPHGFGSYADAVWWTSMLLLTIGSEYWPHTPAGKALSLLISIYGFSVLGYITATLASFFVGSDARRLEGPVASTEDIASLHQAIKDLSQKVDELKKANT